MSKFKIQKIWQDSYEDYCQSGHSQSEEQRKTSRAILTCKSGRLGVNVSECSECGHMEFHNNSCRNRNCPICQAVLKEIWVDKRRAEVIDSPYFHVVFTLPHELNPLLYCNQKLLYGLLHRCCAETLLELSSDKNTLEHSLGSSRYSTPGTRNWITMSICTASSPGEGLLLTAGPGSLPQSFSSRSKSSGRSLKGNISPSWTPCTNRKSSFFLLPAGHYSSPRNGKLLKTIFTGKTGALTSKKPSTGLVTPSNIWDAIPTGLRSPTTGSFPLRKQRLLSLRAAGNPGIQSGRSLSAMESLSGAS